MSWFDATNFASLAKTAINQAQKKLDKVLDIKEEDDTTIIPTKPTQQDVRKPLLRQSSVTKAISKEKEALPTKQQFLTPSSSNKRRSILDRKPSQDSTNTSSFADVGDDSFFKDFLADGNTNPSMPPRQENQVSLKAPSSAAASRTSSSDISPKDTPRDVNCSRATMDVQSTTTTLHNHSNVENNDSTVTMRQLNRTESISVAKVLLDTKEDVSPNEIIGDQNDHIDDDEDGADLDTSKFVVLPGVDNIAESTRSASESTLFNDECDNPTMEDKSTEETDTSCRHDIDNLNTPPSMLHAELSNNEVALDSPPPNHGDVSSADMARLPDLVNSEDLVELTEAIVTAEVVDSDNLADRMDTGSNGADSCFDRQASEEDRGYQEPMVASSISDEEKDDESSPVPEPSEATSDVFPPIDRHRQPLMYASTPKPNLYNYANDHANATPSCSVVGQLNQSDDLEPQTSGKESSDSKEDMDGFFASPKIEGSNDDNVEDKKDVEVERLLTVVEARENKLLEVSKENLVLQERIEVLTSQLAMLEETLALGHGDSNNATSLLQEKISRLDTALQEACTERDTLADVLKQSEVCLRSSEEEVVGYTRALQEKETLVAELLEEGEKLSKKELQLNNKIKRLAARAKENERKLEAERQLSENRKEDIDRLTAVIKEKDEAKEKQTAEIKKLESMTDHQEDEISKLKDLIDDLDEKMLPLKTANETALQEINRLNLVCEQKTAEAQEEAMSASLEEQRRLQEKLNDTEQTADKEKRDLLTKIEDLQLSLTRVEQQSCRKEDHYKLEVADLQTRLQAAENRNQDLAQSVTAATRPLLRQIENLQASHRNQLETLENVERNLTSRLTTAEEQCAVAYESDRASRDMAMGAKSRIAGLEAQLKSFKAETQKLSNALENKESCIEELRGQLKSLHNNVAMMELNHASALQKLRDDKRLMENQLVDEKIRFETELTLSKSFYKPEVEDVPSSVQEASQRDPVHRSTSFVLERSPSNSTTGSMVHESTAYRMPTTAALERMQSQLQMKEGEISIMQEEITDLEKAKVSLAQEIVTLSTSNELMELKNNRLGQIEEEFRDLKQKYSAVLQMYGEKAEEVDELRMDLVDVKEMYRQQIEQLLGQR